MSYYVERYVNGKLLWLRILKPHSYLEFYSCFCLLPEFEKESAIKEAERLKQYFPSRRVWIYLSESEGWQTICKPTAHAANRLARNGNEVYEITSG